MEQIIINNIQQPAADELSHASILPTSTSTSDPREQRLGSLIACHYALSDSTHLSSHTERCTDSKLIRKNNKSKSNVWWLVGCRCKDGFFNAVAPCRIYRQELCSSIGARVQLMWFLSSDLKICLLCPSQLMTRQYPSQLRYTVLQSVSSQYSLASLTPKLWRQASVISLINRMSECHSKVFDLCVSENSKP